MKSSAIIPAYNHASLTIDCLNSLLQYTDDDVEIIVVDDHSNKEETDKLIRNLPQVHGYRKINIYKSATNQGFAKACNEGAKFVSRRCDVLIFLNNDVIITDSWYKLAQHLSESIGITGSKLLYPMDKYSHIHQRSIKKGTIQHAGISVDEMPYHVWRFEPSNLKEANIRKTYPYVTGASMAIKKSDFENIGGFNTKYINGCEDLDLCIKIRKLGKEVLYVPESVAYHHETSTRNPETSKNNLALFAEEYKIEMKNDKNFISKEL